MVEKLHKAVGVRASAILQGDHLPWYVPQSLMHEVSVVEASAASGELAAAVTPSRRTIVRG